MPWGLTRYHHTGQSHFVTSTCYHRHSLFTSDASRRVFESALERVRRSFRLRVYGYVVMPDHIHLLVSEPERGTLADAVKSLKQGVARCLIGDADHFWQKRYYDFNVRDHAQFVEKLHYIHWNPVKRDCASALKTGRGAAFSITPRAPRDELKSSPNGPHASASEQREDSVQPSNCPTQAKIRLEWATRPDDGNQFELLSSYTASSRTPAFSPASGGISRGLPTAREIAV